MTEVESREPSTFEKALHSWSEVNLPSLQAELDDPATKIQTFQESTLTSRRALAQRTKEFKKNDEETKLKEIKSLLKLYQTEIDSLTERAKCAEGAFFNVYRAISELPDPKPLLEVSLDSVMTAGEVDELKVENKRLQDELLKYADYEQLKSRLLRMEQKSAEQLANRLKLKEEEMRGEFEEKEKNWKEKEENFVKQVDELKKQVIEFKTQTEVDGLRLQNQSDAFSENKGEDLELLKRENESIELRNLQLEKRNQDLSKELKVVKSGLAKEEAQLKNESKLGELESENATLVAKLDHEKRLIETNTKQQTTKINVLKRDIATLQGELKNLRSKMIQYKDYDDLKQELNTLRAISFGHGDDDDNEDNDDDETDEQDPVKTSSTQLDEILVSRNKKLTAEIAEFRSQHEELINEITQLKKSLTDSNSEVTRLVQLSNKLESDLTHFQPPKLDTMSMISGVTRGTNMTRAQGGSRSGRISPASSIAGGSIREEPIAESESSVLPIITSQRDRFRNRNIELESQIKKQNNIISDLKSQLNKLKQQNTELFERTRYLASYKGSVRRSSRDQDNDPEKQLEESYEESLHPLAKFRQREMERVTSRLSTLERIFLSFAKAILANKTSRMLFLGYCVGLHCLVMAMSVYVMSLHGALTPEVGIIDKSAGSSNPGI